MNVTMLGTGNMGTALARAFLRSGFDTTVWNRTASRAAPLVESGAQMAPDPKSAVAASAVSVVCLDRNAHVEAVLDRARSVLRDRTIVNFTWGTVAEARELSDLAQADGGSYVGGAIFAYPHEVGTEAATMLVSGEAVGSRGVDSLIRTLGRVSHVGDGPGDATVAATASGAIFYHAALGGLFEGLALASRLGLRPRNMIDYMRDAIPTLTHSLDFMLEAIDKGVYETDQATIRVHLDALRMAQGELSAVGQRGDFTATMVQLMERAVDEGRGDQAIAALFELQSAEIRDAIAR